MANWWFFYIFSVWVCRTFWAVLEWKSKSLWSIFCAFLIIANRQWLEIDSLKCCSSLTIMKHFDIHVPRSCSSHQELDRNNPSGRCWQEFQDKKVLPWLWWQRRQEEEAKPCFFFEWNEYYVSIERIIMRIMKKEKHLPINSFFGLGWILTAALAEAKVR